MLRTFSCWLTIASLPLALLASDTGAAMLYGQGKVSLNGNPLPGSSAIFPGDKVETRDNNQARISFSGATVAILGDSSIKLDINAVTLDHGSVSVVTSVSTSVHDCEITVPPVSNLATEYEVRHVEGRVEINARKNDVTIDDRLTSVTLKEGQQAIRENVCKVAAPQKGPPPPATDPKLGRALAATVIVGVTVCILLRCDDPISPYTSRGRGCLC